MEIKKLLSICLLLCLFAVNTQAQTATPDRGCADLVVTFTAGVSLPSYYWDFGDGFDSEEANPQHTYGTPGTYTARLRETENGPDQGTVTVRVFPQPDLSATADPSNGCAPLLVNFSNTSQGSVDDGIDVDGFNWTFGDGANGNTTDFSNITHTYNTTGVFNVGLQLLTTDENCSVTEIVTSVDVSRILGLGFVTDPSPAVTCTAPLTVSFTNTTPNPDDYTFTWDYGDGSPQVSGENPPPKTYTDDGIYEVILSASDANGCQDQFIQRVFVGPPPTDFSFPDDTICVGEIVRFINLSVPGTYSWTFGPGSLPATSFAINPQVRFEEGGLIPITLDVVANIGGCTNSITKNIFVDDPDATFTIVPDYSCTSELPSTFTANNTIAAEYLWLFNDGTTADTRVATNTAVNGDTTIYSINGAIVDSTFLIVVNPSGCSDTLLQRRVIYQPNALFAPSPASGCAPLEVEFEDLSTNDFEIVFWEWDYGDGSPTEVFNTSTDPTHIFTDPGHYDVRLNIRDQIGCVDTSFVFTIEVGGALSPDFTAVDPTNICPGDSVTFIPTNFPNRDSVDAWHFETDAARSFHCFQEDELTWTFASETGNYDATLYVEYNGCVSSVTQTDVVTVQGPIAKIDYEIDCETPFDVTFRDSSNEATSILWSFGDMTDSTDRDLVHTYPDTGDYVVYLDASNPATGCPDSRDSVVIHIRDIHAEFVLLDSQICLGQPYMLDASPSTGVDSRCWRGYTWYFTDTMGIVFGGDIDRPITTPLASIEYVFGTPGFNEVSLVARDINGCLDTAAQELEVFGVYPAFTADDDTICIGQLVNFTDLSTADTTLAEWAWDFGEGGVAGVPSPDHVFGGPKLIDSLTVTLTLTDSLGCEGEVSAVFQVYKPFSDISALPSTNICAGDEISFAATDFTDEGSFLNFNWDFGAGMPGSSTAQNETVTFDTPGAFDVELIYTEDATGCQDTASVPVSVEAFPDAAIDTDVNIDDVICSSTQITFSNVGLTPPDVEAYLWDFGPTVPISIDPSPQLTFPNGDYEVIMTVGTRNGCQNRDTVNFTIIGPEGNLELDRDAICVGETITFSVTDTSDIQEIFWEFGDGETTTTTGTTISYTYDMPTMMEDTMQVTLFGIGNGCENTIQAPFSVIEVIANLIDPPIFGCVGDTIDFVGSSDEATLYEWEFGDGNTDTGVGPGLSEVENIYETEGSYEFLFIAVESFLNCRDTMIGSIDISPNPVVEIAGDLFCEEEANELSLNAPDSSLTYVWGPIDRFNPDENTGLNPSTLPIVDVEQVTFTVTATNDLGCEGTDEQVFGIITQVIAESIADTTVCPNEPFVLPITGVRDYHTFDWTAGDTTTLSCTACNDPVATIPEGGVVYEVKINDPLECFQDDTYSFSFSTPERNFKMPNVFTPEESENNVFRPVSGTEEPDERLQITSFEIYNRWGQKVYDNDSGDAGWDGTRNGTPLASDVYLYIIETNFAGCEGDVFQGNVTLIR
ncbi:MAG: PKD domain-containing protein [Bacteroidota bacterium]